MHRRARRSMSTHNLAHAFEAIVMATAAAGACLVACGGTTVSGAGSDGNLQADGGFDGATGDGGGLSYEGFTKLQPPEACANALSLLPGIHPADENASIQSRHVTVSDTFVADAADGGATDATGCREGVLTDVLVEAYGTACDRASDKASCLHRVSCVTPPGARWLTEICSGPCSQTNEGTFYIEVDGETVSFPTDLKAMLGPIDTYAEAALVASAAGYRLATGCESTLPAAYRAVGGAFELLVLRAQDCGSGLKQLRIRVNADGTIDVLETAVVKPDTQTACAGGRRPEGFVLEEAGGASRSIAEYLTELALLEAASIAEFARLRDELRTHGAPRSLVYAAEEARRDEIMHARVTQQLARAFGGAARRVTLDAQAPRSLAELAVHNAVEGCVRETFGALAATWQARNAAHPEIARAFVRIAADETRHAAFSWDLAAWLEGELDEAALARVANARAHAIEQLRSSLAVEPAGDVASLAGAPSAAIAQGLCDQMTKLFALDVAA